MAFQLSTALRNAATVVVTDAVNGKCVVSWAAGVLQLAQQALLQLRVTKNGEVQTVYSDSLQVKASAF